MYCGNWNGLTIIRGVSKVNQTLAILRKISLSKKLHEGIDTPPLQWHAWVIEASLMAISSLEITID
jgi:hypothetical protein